MRWPPDTDFSLALRPTIATHGLVDRRGMTRLLRETIVGADLYSEGCISDRVTARWLCASGLQHFAGHFALCLPATKRAVRGTWLGAARLTVSGQAVSGREGKPRWVSDPRLPMAGSGK